MSRLQSTHPEARPPLPGRPPRPAEFFRRLPLRDIKWHEAFTPRRSDPDLRPVSLGFLLLISAGAALLMLPEVRLPGRNLGWLDAFFLSTSAVCVTGLTTVNVAETFNIFGQAVILLLIQLGGLGIVTASLALVMLGGKRLSLAHEGAVAATIGRLQRAQPADLFRFSCLVVALCEAAGTAGLYLRLRTLNPSVDSLTLLWQALFHAVSGFCNAGLSIFPEGLARWRDDGLLLGITDILVIAGGIGLLSLLNLRYYAFWRRDPRQRGRIAVQTKLVAVVTLVLLLVGTLTTLLFEWNFSLAGQALGSKVSWAFFHSAMTRTAGFNVVDLGAMQPVTLAASMVLMFIGGSPGSMAGGIKTVTLAVLFLTARNALRRGETVEVFHRGINPRTIGIAIMVTLLATGAVGVGIAALMLTELGGPAVNAPGGWLGLAFEAVSAFGTVGLSTGATPLLSTGGRLAVIALMFAGRVGPLLLAVYLARPVRPWRIRYPEEDISLG